MAESTPEHVLLIFKKSLYQIYFVDKHPGKSGLEGVTDEDISRWKEAHEHHLAVLAGVKAQLDARGIKYRDVYRARQVSYGPHDMVISVGGDGTLIEASRRIGLQPILGVNSDPKRSVGHYCCATAHTFSEVFDAYCQGNAAITPLNRIQMQLDDEPLEITAINDILIAHHRPAAFSRYVISIGGDHEEHFGSGIWVSTAMGSFGAVRSAGGIQMDEASSDLQYFPRELYRANGRTYRFEGGILPAGQQLAITSRMREGEISIDGCRCRLPFGYGRTLTLGNAPQPVNLITGSL